MIKNEKFRRQLRTLRIDYEMHRNTQSIVEDVGPFTGQCDNELGEGQHEDIADVTIVRLAFKISCMYYN